MEKCCCQPLPYCLAAIPDPLKNTHFGKNNFSSSQIGFIHCEISNSQKACKLLVEEALVYRDEHIYPFWFLSVYKFSMLIFCTFPHKSAISEKFLMQNNQHFTYFCMHFCLKHSFLQKLFSIMGCISVCYL